LVEKSTVSLKIYNLLGQEVRTLFIGVLNAGENHFLWDGTNNSGSQLASGVYVYQLTMGDKISLTRRMLLIQ
jgi:flagellar hook assembly protein FlgD